MPNLFHHLVACAFACILLCSFFFLLICIFMILFSIFVQHVRLIACVWVNDIHRPMLSRDSGCEIERLQDDIKQRTRHHRTDVSMCIAVASRPWYEASYDRLGPYDLRRSATGSSAGVASRKTHRPTDPCIILLLSLLVLTFQHYTPQKQTYTTHCKQSMKSSFVQWWDAVSVCTEWQSRIHCDCGGPHAWPSLIGHVASPE